MITNLLFIRELLKLKDKDVIREINDITPSSNDELLMEDCLYVMVISMDYSKFLLGKLFFNFKSAIPSF